MPSQRRHVRRGRILGCRPSTARRILRADTGREFESRLSSPRNVFRKLSADSGRTGSVDSLVDLPVEFTAQSVTALTSCCRLISGNDSFERRRFTPSGKPTPCRPRRPEPVVGEKVRATRATRQQGVRLPHSSMPRTRRLAVESDVEGASGSCFARPAQRSGDDRTEGVKRLEPRVTRRCCQPA